MSSYVIGIDFGTLSARAVLLDNETKETLCESVFEYPSGVIDDTLKGGIKLPPLYALQDPKDYIDALSFTCKDIIIKSRISPEFIKGIGIDFTSCTFLPVDVNMTPLCFIEEYKNSPHAYAKLWKHHGAYAEAEEINRIAKERSEGFLSFNGGKISSESLLPKVLEILRKAPDIYERTYRFLEAGDYISYLLTGKESHATAFAGFKGLWSDKDGYPDNSFMSAINPRLSGIIGTKISSEVTPLTSVAGVISDFGSKLTGLTPGTPVAMPMIDAHAGVPALNITSDGDLMMILGTSSCHILNSTVKRDVLGICGYVKDSVIPGMYTYEAGQTGVGDIFDWFTKNYVPSSYTAEAEALGINVHALLRKKAESYRPGESGLIALDWVNGNRNILNNASLSGMILGMTLSTKPEEIYRAWIEATAFGARMIFEQFENSGIRINRIICAGGIAGKDKMMMQIYSDILGKEIDVSSNSQAAAVGSAIYAACAAGLYPDVKTASEAFAKPCSVNYKPNFENKKIYDALYSEYKRLHDYFGKDENRVMQTLCKLRG